MLNFYQIVRDNLNFNRFQYEDTVCLEYSCPLDSEQIGIFSRNDYIVHVLSGKKTYKTKDGEWTVKKGETLYLKKGAEIIQQYFDDQYCMLGFFISDHLIRETYQEAKSKMKLSRTASMTDFTVSEVAHSEYLEGYFHSMLTYFRGENRPPDHIMVLKLKELLITLMSSDPQLTDYFNSLANSDKPSLRQIMENNFRFNLRLENYAELSHRSLSSFKRDFRQQFNMSPGKWLLQRKLKYATNIMSSTSLSISQVAYDSGFEDLSHFSRVFKNNIGLSPSEYKKTHIKA